VPIETVRLGHGVALSEAAAASAAAEARRRHGIPRHAIVFGSYGALTPDKRIRQILAAFAATRAYVPHAHLLLAGALAPHCDVRGDIERLRLDDCATLTGYLQKEDDLTGVIAACDVALSLRWPTAREISGPWLRCLAAAKPTITIDLAHTSSVPSIDPRTWQPNPPGESACTIAIDIVDEDHSLRLAMRRLAQDEALRVTLGRAARRYWEQHHSIAGMADDYRRVIARAIAAPAPDAGSPLPGHLLDNGAGTLQKVMRDIGLPVPLHVSPERCEAGTTQGRTEVDIDDTR
jgi:glycosyltransferase involved in cell wall biosynthesis